MSDPPLVGLNFLCILHSFVENHWPNAAFIGSQNIFVGAAEGRPCLLILAPSFARHVASSDPFQWPFPTSTHGYICNYLPSVIISFVRQVIDERKAVSNDTFVGGGRPKAALTCAWLIREQSFSISVNCTCHVAWPIRAPRPWRYLRATCRPFPMAHLWRAFTPSVYIHIYSPNQYFSCLVLSWLVCSRLNSFLIRSVPDWWFPGKYFAWFVFFPD